MVLTVNGEESHVQAGTVQALVAELGYDDGFVAVALNHEVVQRKRWHEAALAEGDSVEILTPRQGG